MKDEAIVTEKCRLISHGPVPGGMYRSLFYGPNIVSRSSPMQFVNVKIREGTQPLLRRPFAFSAIHKDSGVFEITFAVVGEGTEMMARWEKGVHVDILGPLGNGFEPDWPDLDEDVVIHLIGGGGGLAPLYPVAFMACAKGFKVNLYYGSRDKEVFQGTERFRGAVNKMFISTEDGSFGMKGTVGDLVERHISSMDKKDIILSCGSTPMQKAVSALLKDYPNHYVSLEERMACGVGLCKGCAVKKKHGDGYFHVCSEGPVFLADEVALEGGE